MQVVILITRFLGIPGVYLPRTLNIFLTEIISLLVITLGTGKLFN